MDDDETTDWRLALERDSLTAHEATSPMFGDEELVFTRDDQADIHSGGFSIQSMLLKHQIPPIITYNVRGGANEGAGGTQVSDLFKDLVVPNWAFQSGGKRKTAVSEPAASVGVLDDHLHQKLLDLVRMRRDELAKMEPTTNKKGTQKRRSKSQSGGRGTGKLRSVSTSRS